MSMQHNLKMYSSAKYFKNVKNQFRKFYSTQNQRKNHYDTLGVTAKATQSDIKSAYYKLSMVHHPDKNKDCEIAALKFRDLTEAYEVLGNVRTRRLYDKGLYIDNIGTYEEPPMNKFYKSRETKSRPPAPYGRTTVYDFDEWSRSHYGATFQRDMRFKRQQVYKKKQERRTEGDMQSEQVIFIISVLFLIIFYGLYDKNYDNPEKVTGIGGSLIITTKSKD